MNVESFLALTETSNPEEMLRILARTYGIMSQLLESVREGRDLIERTAVQKLHGTEAKLHEISDTTESAAFDMLDGLDRALALVDRLEKEELQRPTAVTAEIREEIYGVIGHLQFQDITSQQLNHVSSVLQEMELQLGDFVRLFGSGEGVERRPYYVRQGTFDPAATLEAAADRQLMVDRLIDGARS